MLVESLVEIEDYFESVLVHLGNQVNQFGEMLLIICLSVTSGYGYLLVRDVREALVGECEKLLARLVSDDHELHDVAGVVFGVEVDQSLSQVGMVQSAQVPRAELIELALHIRYLLQQSVLPSRVLRYILAMLTIHRLQLPRSQILVEKRLDEKLSEPIQTLFQTLVFHIEVVVRLHLTGIGIATTPVLTHIISILSSVLVLLASQK